MTRRFFYLKTRRALRMAREYDGETREAILRVARSWRDLGRRIRSAA